MEASWPSRWNPASKESPCSIPNGCLLISPCRIRPPSPAEFCSSSVPVRTPSKVQSGDISQLLTGRETLNSNHAILHALDASTGKELWSSGNTVSGWTHFSGLAVGAGKVFVTTHDGAVYAFGLRPPGSPAARSTVISGPSSAATPARPQTPVGVVHLAECGTSNATFVQRCAVCHGPEGKGLSASKTPNFTDPDWQTGRTDKDLIDALTKGTDKGMPGFEGQLSSDQIDSMIHCLVRGFARAPQGR
jgi:cytochrome c553